MGRLTFQEAGHRYFLDGVEIPGNTSMLKAAGLIDDTRFTPESRDRGIRVHDAVWFEDEGALDWSTVREEEKPRVEAFQDFKLKTGWRSDVNEALVHSETLRFATRPDLVGVMEGARWTVNVKTGDPSKWVGLQLAGEEIAINEVIQANAEDWVHRLEWFGGHPYVTRRAALHLKANGKWRLIPFENPADRPTFEGLVRLHHWRAAHGYTV